MVQPSIDMSPREVTRRAVQRLGTLLILLCALPFVACWPPKLPPAVASVTRVFPPRDAVLSEPPTTVRATMSFRLDEHIEDHWLVVLVAGVPVAGDLSIDAGDSGTLVFRPEAPLPRGQQIAAACHAEVRSTSGRRLGASVTWSFFVAVEGATELGFLDVATVWSGDRPVDLAPLVRTGSGEVGMNFCTTTPNASWFGAFWTEGAGSWSPLSIAPNVSLLASPTGLHMAADGEGGMLCCDVTTGVAVHHGRDLNALRVDVPAGSFAIGRHPGGPTTIWRVGALSVDEPASLDWDAAARRWLPNPSVVSAVATGSLLGVLPGDTTRVHKVLTLPAQSSSESVDLVVVLRDRIGNELPPQSLGHFDARTVFAIASADDGRALIAGLEPDPAGTHVTAVEYLPGAGWSSPAVLWERQGGGQEPSSLVVAIAAGGAAVVAQSDSSTGSLFVRAREPSGSWGPEFSWRSEVGPVGAAVHADGGALVAVQGSTDVWLAGSRPGGPWSGPRSLREVGWLAPGPLAVRQVELMATESGVFLVAQSVAAPSPSGPWVLQTGRVLLR